MGRAVLMVLVLSACGRLGYDEQIADGADASLPDVPDGLARITVQRMGTGTGTIVGSDGFTCSDASCELVVPIGTSVWLRGLAATDSWFGGWTSLCGGNFECRFTATASATILADFSPMPNRVFVTSTTTDGAFGGIAGADAICAARASAAGLTGSYVAFLADATTTAVSRLGGSRGWVRLDGAPVADAPTALATGAIIFPPRLDEFGTDLGNVVVWTGSNWGATVADRCLDWTSNQAVDDGGTTRAQYASSVASSSKRACSLQHHLMCMETGRTIPVAVRPDTGKLAFTTRTTWQPGNGRATADTLCASEAASAGLAGTFLAAMATTTESIASRFAAGEVYRRVDGVRLFRDAGMFDVDFLDVPPELDQFGVRVSDDYWTGTGRWNTPTTLANSCTDWTDGAGTSSGEMHFTTYTEIKNAAKSDACDIAFPVLCLEQ